MALNDLLFRVGVDVKGFREGLGDAIEALEKTGDRATKTGTAISKAFDRLGVGDAGAKIASEMKKVEQSFGLLEKAFNDGKISADDFAKASAGVADKLRDLGAVKVPVDQFEKLGDALKNLKIDKSAFQIDAQVNELKSSLAEVERAYKAGEVSANELATAQRNLKSQIAELKFDTSGIEKLKSTLSSVGSSMREVGGILTGALTLPIVAVGASAIKTAADFESLQIGLKAVTKEAGPLSAQLDRLKEVAKLPGLGFKEAVQGSINLQAAGFSAKTAERALAAFGNALATVGKGRVELDGVITALSQIASKGKISAEEINQLAERLPQIRVAIKGAFGEGLIDAKDFEKAGITAETFIEKIIQQFEKLPKATGGFRNDMENLKDAADQALNAIGKLLLPLASQTLNAVAPLIDFAQKGAEAFGRLPAPVQAAAGAFTALLVSLGPIIGAGGLLAGAANSFITLGGTLSAAAAGTGPLAAAFTTLAGSLGIVVPLLTAVGVAIAGWAIYEAVGKLREVNAELDRLYALQTKGAQATSGQAEQIRILTSALEQHNKQIGAQRVEVSSAGKSIDQYIGDLKSAVGNLDEFKGKQGAVIGQLKDGKVDIAAVAAEYRGLGTSASGASKGVQEIQAATKAAAQAYKDALKNFNETKALASKGLASPADLAEAFNRLKSAAAAAHPSLTQVGTDLKNVGKGAEESAASLRKAAEAAAKHAAAVRDALRGAAEGNLFKFRVETGEFDQDTQEIRASIDKMIADFERAKVAAGDFSGVISHTLDQATKEALSLSTHLEALGVTTEGTLARQAEAARAHLDAIESQVDAQGNLLATQNEYDQGLKRVTESEIKLRIVRGESYEDLQEKLDGINVRLGNQGAIVKSTGEAVKAVKTVWSELGQDISQAFDRMASGLADSIVQWKGFGETLKNVWKGLASDILNTMIKSFLEPFKKAFTDLLLGSNGKGGLFGGLISDLGSQLSGLFGAGKSSTTAISTAGGGFGAGKSAFGNVGGGAASGASSAVSGLASAANVANIAGAVAQVAGVIIQAFQMSEVNKTLDKIVLHTLETKNELSNLRKDSWDREAHLMLKLDDIWSTLRDRLTEIREALRSSVSLNLSLGSNTQKANEVTQDILRRLNTPDTTVGDRLTETNSILRHIDGGQVEWSQNIIRALDTHAATIIGQLHLIAENTHKNWFEKFFGGGGGIGGAIGGAFSGIGAGIGNIFKGLFGGGDDNKWQALTEENTRYAKGYLLQILTEAQKYWPRLADIRDAWYAYFGYFGSLMSSVEGLPDAFSRAIGSGIQSMADSVDRLVQILGGISPDTGEVKIENMDQLAQVLSQSFSDLGNQFALSIAGLASDLKGAISDATNTFVGAIASMSEAFGKPLENLVQNLKTGDTTGGAVGAIVKYTTDLTLLLQTQAAQAQEITSLKAAIQSTKDETLKAGLQAKLTALEAEKGKTDAAVAALREGMSAVATNTNKAIQTTADGAATVAQKVEALRTYYGQLVQDEMVILSKLPPDIRQELEGGALAADLSKLDGIDESTKNALRAYDRIVSELGAVKGAIEDLGKLPATGTGSGTDSSSQLAAAYRKFDAIADQLEAAGFKKMGEALLRDSSARGAVLEGLKAVTRGDVSQAQSMFDDLLSAAETIRSLGGSIDPAGRSSASSGTDFSANRVDTSSVKTDPGLQSVFEAIQNLTSTVADNFAHLFEILLNGVTVATQTAQQQTTEANQTQTAIDANTAATMEGSESVASAIQQSTAWTSASITDAGNAIVDATRDTAAAVSEAVASASGATRAMISSAWEAIAPAAVTAPAAEPSRQWQAYVGDPRTALAPVDWIPREVPGFESGSTTIVGPPKGTGDTYNISFTNPLIDRGVADYFVRQLRNGGLAAY